MYVKGLKWIIGNGESMNLWQDFWLPKGLQSHIHGLLARNEECLTVKQCHSGSLGWSLHNLSFELPSELIEDIKATPFSNDPNTQDSLAWAFSKDGWFSIKSAYLLARDLNPLNPRMDYVSWVWKMDAPPKILFFLWLCLHNSLPTCTILGSRGLNLSLSYPICNEDYESIDHLLRRCKTTVELWQKLEFPLYLVDSFNKLLAEWLLVNCKMDVSSKFLGIPWKIIFIMSIWQIWTHKNEVVFRTGRGDPNLVKRCIQSNVEYFSIGMKTKIHPSKICVPVAWQKPPFGWAILNTDGSALGNPGRTGGGGVIRDHSSHWIKGYSRALGTTYSFTAELWALRDGLIIVKDLGITNLIVELDALSVIHMLSSDKPYSIMEPLLSDCKSLYRTIPNKRIQHVYQEANQCANALARLGSSVVSSFVVFVEPPPVVVNLLALDVVGNFCNKHVNSYF